MKLKVKVAKTLWDCVSTVSASPQTPKLSDEGFCWCCGQARHALRTINVGPFTYCREIRRTSRREANTWKNLQSSGAQLSARRIWLEGDITAILFTLTRECTTTSTAVRTIWTESCTFFRTLVCSGATINPALSASLIGFWEYLQATTCLHHVLNLFILQ